MSERYRVMCVDEARRIFPGWDYLDYGGVLLEFDGRGHDVRLVAWDGGESEDQTFLRDWDWVAPELNAAVTGARLRIVAQLRERIDALNAEWRNRPCNLAEEREPHGSYRHELFSRALELERAVKTIEGGEDG